MLCSFAVPGLPFFRQAFLEKYAEHWLDCRLPGASVKLLNAMIALAQGRAKALPALRLLKCSQSSPSCRTSYLQRSHERLHRYIHRYLSHRNVVYYTEMTKTLMTGVSL